MKAAEREPLGREEGTGREHPDWRVFPELHLCFWPKGQGLFLHVTADPAHYR